MKEYERTTITIPKDIYQKVKMRAALKNRSVSWFITDILQKTTRGSRMKEGPLPFGKYSFGGKKIHRKDIYESYLRGKISH